jgi:hypothetical protein
MGIKDFFFFLSHRTRIKGKLCRELHARRQAKGVHVQHWVVWIQKLCHRVETLGTSANLETWALLAELLLWYVRERFGVWARPGFGGVLVIDHVGLRIVLLFCDHGSDLAQKLCTGGGSLPSCSI